MVDFDGISKSEWFSDTSPFRLGYATHNPKVCVITGANASGKSLLRKLIHNEYLDRKVELMHLSQAARSRMGIHRVFLYGTEEDQSTGYNSTKTLLDAIKTSKARERPHSILFDEPEIGCSDELAAGLGFHLVATLPELWENTLECCYIISHNRYLVREIRSLNPSHVHLMAPHENYMKLGEWIDRTITRVYDLDSVKQRGLAGWKFVQHQINENRRSK